MFVNIHLFLLCFLYFIFFIYLYKVYVFIYNATNEESSRDQIQKKQEIFYNNTHQDFHTKTDVFPTIS